MRPAPTLLSLVVILGLLVATASVVGLVLRRLMRAGGEPLAAAAVIVVAALVFTAMSVAALVLVPHLEAIIRA